MGRKLLIVVIILIVGVGAYFVYQSASNSKQSNSTASFTDAGMQLSSGSKSINVQYLADPTSVNYGIGIYPGATADSTKGSSATAKINDANVTYGTFVTSANSETVLAYYKKQMGSQAQVSTLNNGETAFTVVTIKGQQSPIVTVFTEDSKTKFRILKKN